MEVKAVLRYYRKSPRKIRLIINVIRGLSVAAAETQLRFMQRDASQQVLKLLKSAIANAEHNFGLKSDNLFVKAAMVDGGPTIKRWRPRAQGRATPIRKRTSHITIILGEIDGGTKPVAKEAAKEVKGTPKAETEVTAKAPKAAKAKTTAAAPKSKKVATKTAKTKANS